MSENVLERDRISTDICIMIKRLPHMISRFITLSALLVMPLFAKAQCTASFTFTTSGLTATFTGTTSPPTSPNTNFYWWFSDGNNSSSVQNPTYTFSAPGTYTVCFSYYDFTTQCSDSICQSVTVGSSGCFASWTSIDSMGTMYFFGSSTLGANANYIWNFGDGGYSNAMNPSYVYSTPGTYQVCLHVFDSLMNFCDSSCVNITVPGQSSCNADFTAIDSLGYVFFLSSSSLGAGAYYYWDFGDGNYSTAQSPSHVYANPGYYTVCLTVYDSMQNFCDSTCHTVQASVTAVQETNFLQSSFAVAPVPADGALSLSFMSTGADVATIRFYDAAGRIATAETVQVHGSGYNKTEINTTNMADGIYLVKIELNGSEAWTRIAITHQ